MYKRNAKFKIYNNKLNKTKADGKILRKHINSNKNILSIFTMLANFVDIKYCVNLIFKFTKMTKRINKQAQMYIFV